MTKYSLKLILWKHNTNDKGQFPIYLKLTVNRQTTYLSTGYYISDKQWDEKNERVKPGHHQADIINPDITNRRNEVSKRIVELQVEGIPITAKQLKLMFASGKDLNNVFDFADAFIKEVQHKREASTLENYRKHLLKLEQFHGSKTLSFEEIDNTYLSKYENHLRESVGNNYTHALFKTLKSFFNAAIKRGITTAYPFRTYENPVYEAPIKDYLVLGELHKWEAFADEEEDMVLKQTAVYFLLGVYTGIRISDWFRFDLNENIKDGRVYLRAKKNGEWVTMPVNKPLKRNLTRMKRLPLSIEEPTINEKLKVIAKKLKINKHITSHTARHTFAITICAERGISSETCSELMGITVKTCVENYYRVTNRKIDSETLKAWEGL